ncbi:coiled-coil domain-containing protein 58 [Contarinia nasturtii]|uniref:coiled-coil domain-containing protein 58 n=1 Tax=Contarinia nasturtii TaxID=265458 RepID=UPI0012D4009E|nr:coiled-coil domain-containing protein 58 [Contarinia nasturtii]
MAIQYTCGDFMLFQEQLKKMRNVDDKIIYALNTSIPTESFKGQLSATEKCKDLYSSLESTYESRNNIIKNCIAITANRVKELKSKKDNDPDDVNVCKDFKSEQRKLRLLQSELSVEDIIKERTMKIFYEKCKVFIN